MRMDETRLFLTVEMARKRMADGDDIAHAVAQAMTRYAMPVWATTACLARVARAELACSSSRLEMNEMKRRAKAECDR
jgi:hypothetical protein